MKIVVLEIYHYHRNRVSKVEVELFNEMETCRQFVNKYFEQIDYENNEVSIYENGFIVNLYEDYFYTVGEKTVK